MDIYRTVVVVGAGASAELGLPLGHDLKGQIANLFASGSRSHDELTYEAAQYADEEESGPFPRERKHWEAGLRVAQGMSQALSIDNYINDHRDNARVATISKIAIVRCITRAERRCPLYQEPSGGISGRPRTANYFDFQKTEDTWLNSFFRILTQSCTLEELNERLSGVTFVVFNYDRCIEVFAAMWVASYHQISHVEAAEVVSAMKIYHPYGKVGELTRAQSPTGRSSFGSQTDGAGLHKLSASIRTFTESSDNDSEIEVIRQSLDLAQQVIFLGFGFIDLNMKLLASPGKRYTPQRIIGTACGVSQFNLDVIRGSLYEMFDTSDKDVHLPDQKCRELVVNYSRALEPT